ncbi:hybrid sensor histidine kinase/response regulator [Desulfogranum japonicum]|uniref:hybrid sensor histidine kinase/response regulator n=1 Tax=Desulfogranum japonicum TaxID=231447 RepID=UPI0003F5F90A|nr:hybrid sensor histidine kinase/response regulator [Desulfogranum japonicum]
MKHFLDWSISRKLSVIVIITSGLLIGIMAVAITVEKVLTFRHSVQDKMTVLLQITGTNSTAALIFQDQETAGEILSALEAEDSVLAAILFDADKKRFATYTRQNWKPEEGESNTSGTVLPLPSKYNDQHIQAFTNDRFSIFGPVLLNGKTIGHIGILADLSPIQTQIVYFTVMLFVFSVLLFVLGLVITFRLNRSLIKPIFNLVEGMQIVSAEQHYGIRVTKEREDELGVLIDGFNNMLSQIQKRDYELDRHRNQLTELVNQRTEELRQTNAQLIEEIEERKAAEAQLAHAQKMEAIGTLAGGVAHDLNNILSGIVTYPDLLLATLPEDSPLYKPLNAIKTSGSKAAAIVQDLLTLARRGVKVEERVELGNLIKDHLRSPESLEMLVNHPNVKIIFEKPEQDLPLIGSPVHLSKMLMNLLANAAEAMPEGGNIVISCQVMRLKKQPVGFKDWRSGDYVQVTIQDTGVGIPEQFIDRIFEPFYSSKVMGLSGSGLGMAVVWGTVEDHHGLITVNSTEGEGTTFSILLPLAVKETVSKIDVAGNKPIMGQGQSVLVVDDSQNQRMIAEDIFIHLGYLVETVESGEKALEFLMHKPMDLVLLDMLMDPGMDGLETYQHILRLYPDQKAIIASGFASSERIQDAIDMGVKSYILKPYTISDIATAVDLALKK